MCVCRQSATLILCRSGGLANSVCCARPQRIRPSQFPLALVARELAVS